MGDPESFWIAAAEVVALGPPKGCLAGVPKAAGRRKGPSPAVCATVFKMAPLFDLSCSEAGCSPLPDWFLTGQSPLTRFVGITSVGLHHKGGGGQD